MTDVLEAQSRDPARGDNAPKPVGATASAMRSFLVALPKRRGLLATTVT
jgi:hypothetical protein